MHVSSLGGLGVASTEVQANPVRLARVFGVRELPDGPAAAEESVRRAQMQRYTGSIGAGVAALLLFAIVYNIYGRRGNT